MQMMSGIITSPTTRNMEQKSPTPMADIEASVSKLLMTTKKLLETLTAWSAGQVNDTQVYTEYNLLEAHFISATRAFESALLPMDDMFHLPNDLQACLNDALSKEPSSATLEHYLPSIRDIILRLLQGLKERQSLMRERFEPVTNLSPINTTPMPLPSPSSSTEHPQVPHPHASPAEEIDMDDPSTKNAMNALKLQEDLARRSSVRKASNLHKKEFVIALYLKIGDRVKKVSVDASSLYISALQNLFQDKFGCTGNVIWILDHESNVEYELEDVSDIKPYSILSIKDKDNSLDDEMKTLFKDTLTQVRQTIQTNKTPIIPTEKIKEQQEEITSLRHDLAIVRTVYQDFKKDTEIIIHELREKSKQQSLHTIVIMDPTTRADMNSGREVTQKAATLITNRLEALQDTIDQIKTDVTHKRRRPSKAQLDHCKKEFETVQMEMNDLVNRVKLVKPIWKKTWEVELQQIVKEQQFLKEHEALLADLREDHQSVEQVLNQLLKISEIQERKKQSGVSLFNVAPAEEGFEGMTSVMKQVSTIQVDHSRRVKALAEAEKARSKELSQRIDAFERELTDFVSLRKLKNTGGPEAIDRQRQERDKDLIKQIFVDSNASQAEKNLNHDDETLLKQ